MEKFHGIALHRPLRLHDLRNTMEIQADPYTATFASRFYFDYLAHFPEQCFTEESPSGALKGYMIAKDEGHKQKTEYHVHVSAVTVSPMHRKQGVARRLMGHLEAVGNAYHCDFCDLFVKASNIAAVEMYRHFEYVIYRTLLEYYDSENGYDMRKALLCDPARKTEQIEKSKSTLRKWTDYPF